MDPGFHWTLSIETLYLSLYIIQAYHKRFCGVIYDAGGSVTCITHAVHLELACVIIQPSWMAKIRIHSDELCLSCGNRSTDIASLRAACQLAVCCAQQHVPYLYIITHISKCALAALCIKQDAISCQTYNISTVFCAHHECTINFSLLYNSMAKDRSSSTSSASSVPIMSSKPTTTSSTSKSVMHACVHVCIVLLSFQVLPVQQVCLPV